MALDRSGEALALGDASDLDGLTLGKLGDGERVTDLQVTAPLGNFDGLFAFGRLGSRRGCKVIDDAAELNELARCRRAGLLEQASCGPVQLLFWDLIERELHGVVAVALRVPETGYVAGAGQDRGHALHLAVLLEDLGHPDLLSDQTCHCSKNLSLNPNLDVDAAGKLVESLKRVDSLGRRVMNVDQPLVCADLEVLT